MSGSVCWVDGRLQPADAAALRADDSAFTEGRGCYTSVRIRGGAPRFGERHVARLVRDARSLELPAPDPRMLERAVLELAGAAFATGEGVVRLQLSRDGQGALHVVGVPRDLGADPASWRAVTAPFPHPGPTLPGGPKQTGRLPLARASEAARRAGAQEALLFDAAGRLVEGARSNLVLLDAERVLCSPPLARGAVAGIALELVREALPELCWRDLSRRALLRARGVVALNAVRGARPLIALDGEPLGPDAGELAERLARVLG